MLVLCVGFARNRIIALCYASCGVSLVIGYMLTYISPPRIQNIQRNVQNLTRPSQQQISWDSSVSARLAAKKPDPRLERLVGTWDAQRLPHY